MTAVILLFHIARNVSLTLYLLVLGVCYLALFLHYRPRNFSVVKIWFVLSLLWIPLISLFYLTPEDFLGALPRFLITLPFVVFCSYYGNFNLRETLKFFRVFCIFVTFSSLSVVYQVAFGALPFLADPSVREGLVRFSSLAGSLTALGIIGGFAVVVLMFLGHRLFGSAIATSLVVVNVIGMLATLQKAAVVNLALCLILYVCINRRSLLARLAPIWTLIIGGFGFYLLAGDSALGRYISTTVYYTIAIEDRLVGDLAQRLWTLPMLVARFHDVGTLGWMTGIGMAALSGTVGLPHLPMTHNWFFDSVLSGGIIHLLLFLGLAIKVPLTVLSKKIKGRPITDIDYAYVAIFVIFVANSLIGLTTYHPVIAVLFFYWAFSYSGLSIETRNQGQAS